MSISAGQDALASDFVSTPSGAGDSGKISKLDSRGKIPSGFIDGLVVSFPAGESITAGKCVALIDDFQQCDSSFSQTVTFGSSGTELQAGRIIPRQTATIQNINMILKRISSDADNVQIEIQGDSGGSPNNTPITNGTSDAVAISTLTGNYLLKAFNFSTPPTLTANTTYWVVIKRTGTLGANIYALAGSASYASFTGKNYYSSAWHSNGGVGIYFQMQLATGSPSLTVWKCDNAGSNSLISHAYGIALNTVSQGSAVNILTDGISSDQSGLVANSVYYVGSSGALSLTPETTYGHRVGIALSATQIKIDNKPYYATGYSESFVSDNSDAHFHVNTGFRPRRVTIYLTSGGTNLGGITIGEFIDEQTSSGSYHTGSPGGEMSNSNGIKLYNWTTLYGSLTIGIDNGGFVAYWTRNAGTPTPAFSWLAST